MSHSRTCNTCLAQELLSPEHRLSLSHTTVFLNFFVPLQTSWINIKAGPRVQSCMISLNLVACFPDIVRHTFRGMRRDLLAIHGYGPEPCLQNYLSPGIISFPPISPSKVRVHPVTVIYLYSPTNQLSALPCFTSPIVKFNKPFIEEMPLAGTTSGGTKIHTVGSLSWRRLPVSGCVRVFGLPYRTTTNWVAQNDRNDCVTVLGAGSEIRVLMVVAPSKGWICSLPLSKLLEASGTP